jgi:Lytic transglycolase
MSIMPSGATQRSDTKVLLSLKRNTPGRSPFERRHVCPSQRVHPTAGQKLTPETLTAAHRTLPFGTKVKVTNKSNGRFVVVTINDRGPFVRGRIIDVSPAAARVLGFSGLTQVTVLPVRANAVE